MRLCYLNGCDVRPLVHQRPLHQNQQELLCRERRSGFIILQDTSAEGVVTHCALRGAGGFWCTRAGVKVCVCVCLT